MAAIKSRIISAIVAASIAIVAAALPRYEGTKYTAYADSAGVWTICEGHTRGVEKGDIATPAQCEAFKRDDLIVANSAVDRCVHVQLTVSERAAWIDFTYNVGESAFCSSTAVRKLNSGDHKGACDELPRWTYAGGKQLAGLVVRRAYEHELCTRAD